MGREKLTLEITCANPGCGKAAVLIGPARTDALQKRGGRGYCSRVCGDVNFTRAQVGVLG